MAGSNGFGNGPGGDDLDRRIAAAEAKQARPEVHRGETRGWAVGVEFVGAVLVSAFIGWMIDRWAHTAPWGMIVLLVLGFCAGVRQAAKTSREFDVDADGPAAGDGKGDNRA